MKPGFWTGKRIFLTGHTGFKGSWLSLWLQGLGAKVTGYALKPPTTPSLFKEADIAKGMQSIEGDIRDLNFVKQAMRSAEPEIVFHMAAQPLVCNSYDNPVETYATNVMGTVHMLEAVRSTPSVRAVINVTTDKCYENNEWVWGYRENDPMGGYDPYSNSKGCAELASAAYRNSFFNSQRFDEHRVAIATVRAGNVLGGGDWAKNRLIPDIIRAFELGQPVRIRSPHAIRPWQHVLEPLRGYLTLAERLIEEGPAYAEGWNFGPNDEDAKSVGWIVEKLASLWGSRASWHIDEDEYPHEANYLKLDISKARNRLNWHPALRVEETLKLIVDWSKKRKAEPTYANVRNLCLEQIVSYQQLTEN